jgi:hypothetical protein
LHERLGDTNEAPRRSPQQVLRNGEPLRPAHTVHELIFKRSAGTYSHWHGHLYFSVPDNADPRSDGAT